MSEEEKNEISEEAQEVTEEAARDDEVSEAEAALKESEDKYLRLYAEYENYKKRTQKEKDARYADAMIDAVAEFLPVLDNLDRATASEAEGDEAKGILDGIELIKKQMTDSLLKLGVTEIKALGEEFNPNLHNAVMHTEDDSITENTVVEEFMKGYIYKNERVVRYSMVKVAN